MWMVPSLLYFVIFFEVDFLRRAPQTPRPPFEDFPHLCYQDRSVLREIDSTGIVVCCLTLCFGPAS